MSANASNNDTKTIIKTNPQVLTLHIRTVRASDLDSSLTAIVVQFCNELYVFAVSETSESRCLNDSLIIKRGNMLDVLLRLNLLKDTHGASSFLT